MQITLTRCTGSSASGDPGSWSQDSVDGLMSGADSVDGWGSGAGRILISSHY